MDKPICSAMTGSSTNASMTDPKKAEAQSEELKLEQLEDAAGGAAFMKLGDIKGEVVDKDNKFMTNTFLKDAQKPSQKPSTTSN